MPDILTKEEISKLKERNLNSYGRHQLNGNEIESLVRTIDFLYAKIEALERVKNEVEATFHNDLNQCSPSCELDTRSIDDALATYQNSESKGFRE